MLVVTRKKDEKLIIGNEIEIQVLRIGRDNVRLGIKAPAHISIYRYEIYEAIKNEDDSAVISQIPDKETLENISKDIKLECSMFPVLFFHTSWSKPERLLAIVGYSPQLQY